MNTEHTKTIFVSYTVRDNYLDYCQLVALESYISRFGKPYIDLLHNIDSDPQRYVIEQLEQSSLLIACITPQFFHSPWVQIELKIASRLRIPVVLMSIEKLKSSNYIL